MARMRTFDEATRVQMPAMVHLTRLGYTYFGKVTEDMAGDVYDPDTNIFIEVFKSQFEKLNPEHAGRADEVLRSIRQELDNDDLGRSFYNRLVSSSPVRLVDFDNPANNTFHFTAEFTCKNGQDEFRPDITLFVNGLPLSFVEVKKPNNRGGMVAESTRMNRGRFPNRKFRRFINITQLMIFSNNMEYDAEGGITPIQGVFYCTGARGYAKFSTFREDNPAGSAEAPFHAQFPYAKVDDDVERQILDDYNVQVIRTTPEYATNLKENTPTNRVLTSMVSPERLLFLIKYGIAYVRIDREVDGKIKSTDQKHIMRYQQLFASLAVRQRLNEGVTSGVIWHTQGSGKTALSYYLNNVLTDYYAAHNKVAKFYFIVDRLDLLEQASQEFEARGLEVKTANSRVELMEQFRTNQSLEGDSGRREVTVVNIQRFDEDKTKIDASAYATNLQRVFIIDEAHRGYNPKGSFLANMLESDPNSVKIALTGTPLLKDERASWKVFGDYLHTYYYDKSIQDGYTLKIIREDIETAYRDKLSEIYDSLDHLVLKKEVSKKEIVEHEHYVKELLRYVITDFKRFRTINGDDSLGGMVICETSQQARNIAAYFDEIQAELNATSSNPSKLRAGLILFDSDDKDTQKQIIKDFKKNYTVDILIVFNMLLTGFDAPRLKRLYLGRKLKDHNLLQALTRVNRPYKDHKYGYVVDFADIKQNFDETNAAYLKELNKFNDPEETGEGGRAAIEQVIEDPAALVAQVREARNILFTYDLDNAEEFSRQIAGIDEKETLVELRKALQSIREGINLARAFGDDDLKAAMERMNIEKLPSLLSEVENAIGILNQKEAFTSTDETRRFINEAMLDIEFKFRLKNEEELNILAGAGDKFQAKWRRAIREFTANIDQEDPEFVTLRDAFMHRFKERGFVIDSMSAFDEEDRALDQVMDRLIEIKRRNNALLRRYNGDPKFVRVHKRIREESEQRRRSGQPHMGFEYDEELVELLTIVKKEIDYKISERADILRTDGYFSQVVMQTLALGLAELNLNGTRADKTFMQERIIRQYCDQYTGAHTIA